MGTAVWSLVLGWAGVVWRVGYLLENEVCGGRWWVGFGFFFCLVLGFGSCCGVFV